MIIIKTLGIILIMIIPSYIGIIYSQSFKNRVNDLTDMKNALNIFKAKIKFTYKPIPDVFKEISNETKSNISPIFLKASKYMENDIASYAWVKSIRECKNNTNLNEDDLNVILNLSKMLGNSDIEGQISIIDLTNNMLDKQINDAQIEKEKNSKLYRALGTGIGLAIAIVLI